MSMATTAPPQFSRANTGGTRSTSPAFGSSVTSRTLVHDSLMRSLHGHAMPAVASSTLASPLPSLARSTATATASGSARASDLDNKFIRCIHPAPSDIVNLSLSPHTGQPIANLDVHAAIDPASRTAAIATPFECRIWNPTSGTNYPLVYPDALRTALAGRAPFVALLPTPAATPTASVIPVLCSPSGGVTVVYRLLGTSGDVLDLPSVPSDLASASTDDTVVGLVPLAHACLLLCTQSERFALQLLPAHLLPARSGTSHHGDLHWTALPSPGPATFLSSLFGKLTSSAPTRIRAVALVDQGRQALVLTNKSLEQWGPTPTSPLALQRQSTQSIESVVLGDSAHQYSITHVAASSTLPLTDNLPLVVAVTSSGAARAGAAVQLRTVHDPWTNAAAVSNARPVEAGASPMSDPLLGVHFVARAQCKVVVQSASGIEVVTDPGAKSYLWNAGKRWFVASAPLSVGGSETDDPSAATYNKVPPVLLLELSRGLYEFRASGFDSPASGSLGYPTPIARDLFTPAKSTRLDPTAATPLPPRTPRAELAMHAAGLTSEPAKALFDRANNLFRAPPGMAPPADVHVVQVTQALVHLGLQQPEAAEDVSDRLAHLADVLSQVARGQGARVDAVYAPEVRARVWHAAVVLAVLGAQAGEQVERTGSVESKAYYVQINKDDRDDAHGKYVSKAMVRYWTRMQAARSSRQVSKQAVLDPFAHIFRAARSEGALALASLLRVEDEMQEVVKVGVQAAEWLIASGDAPHAGGQQDETEASAAVDALSLSEATLGAAELLTLAHAGVEAVGNDATTHLWRDAVRALARVNPLQAYTLAQMHVEHVELRAQILAAGHLPNTDASIAEEMRADQAFANALFKTLLVPTADEIREPASEVAARWEQALDKAIAFPDRFEVFLEGARQGVAVPDLVLAHFYVAIGKYPESLPHWFQVLRSTPVEATAVQAVSALHLYQWAVRGETPVSGVDMAVVEHFQALLECQRQLAPTIAAAAGRRFASSATDAADMPAAVDVDVPAYVQLAVGRGGRLPLPWLIDAATPSVLIQLAYVVADAPEAIVGSLRPQLWAKIYQRAVYLVATVAMADGPHVFGEWDGSRQAWLKHGLPHDLAHNGWAAAKDALQPLTLENVKTLEVEVGAVKWGMVAIEDVEATSGAYTKKMAAKALDARLAEVLHAVETLNIELGKRHEHGPGAEEERFHDQERMQDDDNTGDESMMVETERRFEEDKGVHEDHDAMDES